MATFVGDLSDERYTSIAMSKSSSSSSSVATSDASPLEGLDGIEIHLFTGMGGAVVGRYTRISLARC